MKTAREIIAGIVYNQRIDGWTADAILAALAAGGFSIVETGRDPATIEACAKVADEAQAMRERLFAENGASLNASKSVQAEEIASDIRALSRSTREGKTE